MILVVVSTVLLVQRPWTNLWKGRFINTNYYYYYYNIYHSYTEHSQEVNPTSPDQVPMSAVRCIVTMVTCSVVERGCGGQ